MKAKKLVFGYQGGEKSVLTAEDMSKEEIQQICQSIADSTKPFVSLVIPTSKNDILLVNKQTLLFFYATDAVEEDVRAKKDKK